MVVSEKEFGHRKKKNREKKGGGKKKKRKKKNDRQTSNDLVKTVEKVTKCIHNWNVLEGLLGGREEFVNHFLGTT